MKHVLERKVNKVYIHCSASDHDHHDHINVIRQWHLDRKFNDVGYHWFIQKDGTIQEGRSVELAPAAQKHHNRGTLAICLHGLEHFTIQQLTSLRALCDTIEMIIPGCTFHGHCEVSNKTCPVFDYVRVLGLNDLGGRG